VRAKEKNENNFKRVWLFIFIFLFTTLKQILYPENIFSAATAARLRCVIKDSRARGLHVCRPATQRWTACRRSVYLRRFDADHAGNPPTAPPNANRINTPFPMGCSHSQPAVLPKYGGAAAAADTATADMPGDSASSTLSDRSCGASEDVAGPAPLLQLELDAEEPAPLPRNPAAAVASVLLTSTVIRHRRAGGSPKAKAVRITVRPGDGFGPRGRDVKVAPRHAVPELRTAEHEEQRMRGMAAGQPVQAVMATPVLGAAVTRRGAAAQPMPPSPLRSIFGKPTQSMRLTTTALNSSR
jgi:hypothetical protein